MSNVLKMLSRGGAAAAETDPNFNQTVLLLHGDGTNGAQNNTFLDSSTNNFTITRNGNTTQGTFSPFSAEPGKWGNYFDGTDDKLSVSANAAFSMGSGDFTVEAWCFQTGKTDTYPRLIHFGPFWSSNDAWGISPRDNDYPTKITVVSFKLGGRVLISSSDFALNTWNHVVITRASGVFRMFVNGKLEAINSSYVGTAIDSSATNSVCVGSAIDRSLEEDFLGYISNVRVVKGSVVSAYSTSSTTIGATVFTPPTTPLTAITNTSLLTCQSNRFVDNGVANSGTGFTITRNGDVRVTPFSPFAPTAAYSAGTNGGSGYFDGTGDYLTVADNAAFDLSGDFTIEFVAYATGANNRRFLQLGDYRAGNNGLVIYSNASNALVVYVNGATIITGSAFPLNQWVYVALVRSGGGSNNLKLYMNAVQDGQATNTVSFTGVAGNGVAIGAEYGGSYAATAECYISTVRIVNGTALTPAIPTAPLTNITNTSLLLNFTNAGIIDNTGKNNLETVGNAQIDTTTKKFGTGSLEFDGSGDALLLLNQPLMRLSSTEAFTIEFWIYANALSSDQHFIHAYDPASPNTGWAFGFGSAGFANTTMVFWDGTTWRTIGTGFATGTWYHIAVTSQGSSSTGRFFVNGTQQGSSVTFASTIANTATPISIGSFRNAAGALSLGFNGFMDDLRITKGVARYTANFTAPTKEFPDL